MGISFSEMNDLIEEYSMIEPGSTVLCAVSGGMDSIYLLHRLYLLQDILNFRLVAAHYNHQLRGEESERDEAFVRSFVKKFCGEVRLFGGGTVPPVGLIVGRGDVGAQAAERKRGLEETAREMRYAFLREAAETAGANAIATAHHAEDNVETVLLHLLRGTGLQGLAGIAPRQGKLIRPLLTTRRKEMEEYLRLYSLPHVEDSSNADDHYTRNRVRHQLVPLLEELAPGVSDRLTAALPALRAENDYLNAQALQLVREARWEGDTLMMDAARIAEAPAALAPRCARLLLRQMREGDESCTAAHLNGIVALCRGTNPSAELSLPDGLTARREYGQLRFLRGGPPPPLAVTPLRFGGVTAPEHSLWICCCDPDVCPPERIPNVWYLRRDALGPDAVLRPRREGDRITLPRRGTKKLKKLFINAKILKSQRERIPVLADGQGVAGAAGFGCCETRLARPGEDAWRILFLPKQTGKDGKPI